MAHANPPPNEANREAASGWERSEMALQDDVRKTVKDFAEGEKGGKDHVNFDKAFLDLSQEMHKYIKDHPDILRAYFDQVSKAMFGSRDLDLQITGLDGQNHLHLTSQKENQEIVIDDHGHITETHDHRQAQTSDAKAAARPAENQETAKLEREAIEKHHLKNLSPEARRMVHDACTKIKDARIREQFFSDMEAFERRDNLSRAEKDRTYFQLSRLLDAKHLKAPDASPARQQAAREVLSDSVMYHCAHPSHVDQGRYNTCNVTTLAERMYTRYPSMMAEMVATTAIKGEWVNPADGKRIQINPQSLEPADPDTGRVPPQNGIRSYDTQLLNVVMVNDGAQRKHPPQYYVQQQWQSNADNGERLYDWDQGKNTITEATYRVQTDAGTVENKPVRAPGLSDADIQAIGTRLAGESHFLIDSSPQPTDFTGKPVDDGVVHITSKENLAAVLHDMKIHHRLPAIIWVDAHNPLFAGSNAPPGSAHVVSIADYNEQTGRVTISNQWGHWFDIQANIDDLYNATKFDSRQSGDWGFIFDQWKVNTFGNVRHDVG